MSDINALSEEDKAAIKEIGKISGWKHLSNKKIRNAAPIDARCLVDSQGEFVHFANKSGDLDPDDSDEKCGFLVYKKLNMDTAWVKGDSTRPRKNKEVKQVFNIVCYSGATSTTTHACMLRKFADRHDEPVGVYAHADVDLLQNLLGMEKRGIAAFVKKEETKCETLHLDSGKLLTYLDHLNEEACWSRNTQEKAKVEDCMSRWVLTGKPPWNDVWKDVLDTHVPTEATATDEVFRFNDKLVSNLKREFIVPSDKVKVKKDYKKMKGHFYVNTPFDPYVIKPAKGGFLNLYQTSAFDDRIASPLFRYRPTNQIDRPIGFYDVPVGDLVFLLFNSESEKKSKKFSKQITTPKGFCQFFDAELQVIKDLEELEVSKNEHAHCKAEKVPVGSGNYSLTMSTVANLISETYVDHLLAAFPPSSDQRLIAPSRLPHSYSLRERMIDMLAPIQYSSLTSTINKIACQPVNEYAYLCRIYTDKKYKYILPFEFHLPLKKIGRVVILGKNTIEGKTTWDSSKIIKCTNTAFSECCTLQFSKFNEYEDDLKEQYEVFQKNEELFFSESCEMKECTFAYVNGVDLGRLFMDQIEEMCKTKYNINNAQPIVDMFDIHAPFLCLADTNLTGTDLDPDDIWDKYIYGTLLPWDPSKSESVPPIAGKPDNWRGYKSLKNDCFGIVAVEDELFLRMHPDKIDVSPTGLVHKRTNDFVVPQNAAHTENAYKEPFIRISDKLPKCSKFPRDVVNEDHRENGERDCLGTESSVEGELDAGMPYQYFFDAIDLIRKSEFGQLIRADREEDERVVSTRQIFKKAGVNDIDNHLLAKEPRRVDKHDAFCLELRHDGKLIANAFVVNADIFGANAENERRAYRTLNWKFVKSRNANIKSRVEVRSPLKKLVADTSSSRCVEDVLDHFLEQLATYFGQPIVPCNDEPIFKPVKHRTEVVNETPNRAFMANAVYTIERIRICGPNCQLTFSNGTSLTLPRRAALTGKDAKFAGTFDAPLLDSRVLDDGRSTATPRIPFPVQQPPLLSVKHESWPRVLPLLEKLLGADPRAVAIVSDDLAYTFTDVENEALPPHVRRCVRDGCFPVSCPIDRRIVCKDHKGVLHGVVIATAAELADPRVLVKDGEQVYIKGDTGDSLDCAMIRFNQVFEVIPGDSNEPQWTAHTILVDVMGNPTYNCGFVSMPTTSATIRMEYDPPDQTTLLFAPLLVPTADRDRTAVGAGDSFTPDQSTTGLRVRVTPECDEKLGPIALRICAVTDDKTAISGLPNALNAIEAVRHVRISTQALRPVRDDPTALVFDVRSHQAYALDACEHRDGLFFVTVTLVTVNPDACRMAAIRCVRDCLRVDVLAHAVLPQVEQYIDIENRRVDNGIADHHALSHSDVGRHILVSKGALYVDDTLRPCEKQHASLEGVIRSVSATVDGIVRVQTSAGIQCIPNPSTVRRAPYATVRNMYTAFLRVACDTKRFA